MEVYWYICWYNTIICQFTSKALSIKNKNLCSNTLKNQTDTEMTELLLCDLLQQCEKLEDNSQISGKQIALPGTE